MKKGMTVGIAAAAILAGGSLVAWSYHAGQNVPFKQQWPLFEALRATAAIIFAVVGAWLAIIYPDRLRYAFRGSSGERAKSNGGMGKVLSPAIHSTAILSVVLLIGILAPLVVQLAVLQPWKLQLRGLSYALLTLLTLWQLSTIVLTLAPADQVKSEADKEVLKQQTAKGYFNVAQREK